MAGLSAPTAPVVTKSTGNVQSNVNRLKAIRNPVASEAAEGMGNLQLQINALVTALSSPGSLTELTVTDEKGAVIGWVGSRIVDGITYEGGWFENLYIGGTGPADAVISASGTSVTINGASIKITSNGLETDINNETLPEWGAGVSLVSIDTSVPNGDQSFIAPQAMGVFAWDGAAYTGIASIGDAGAGSGFIQLNATGSSDQIALSLGPAVITVFDGTNTTVLAATGINTPSINSAAYAAGGIPGVDLSTNVVTAVAVTSGTLNYGSSLSLNLQPDGVFGTPGAGQTNGFVVTSVSLNVSSTAIVTAAAATTAAHAWHKGLLTG